MPLVVLRDLSDRGISEIGGVVEGTKVDGNVEGLSIFYRAVPKKVK